ncbi:hypothetical protein LINPERPRIM_LOCUS12077 [Linum perenne]
MRPSIHALLLFLTAFLALFHHSTCRPIGSTATKFPFPIPARLSAAMKTKFEKREFDQPMQRISDRCVPAGPNPLHN